MKHITFDESTVLREYARIAGEKGLVKQAEIELGQPVIGNQSPQTDVQKDMIDWEGVGLMKPDDKGPMPIHPPYGESPSPSAADPVAKVSAELQARLEEATKIVQNSPDMASSVYSKVVQDMVAKYPNLKQYINESIYNLTSGKAGVLTKGSSEKFDLTKDAKDSGSQLYDVSGETGEQLIEKAHPGGGTRTELTSKTDENLIETIVEQQKRDIAVALSVPKGTYAALVNLYNKLSKMGTAGKQLNALSLVIKKIATPEVVAEHMLITLADRLDALGNKKAADKVDGIILSLGKPQPPVAPGVAQQVPAAGDANTMKQDAISEVQNLSGGSGAGSVQHEAKKKLLSELQSMNPQSVSQMFVALQGLNNKYRQMLPGIANVNYNIMSKYDSAMRAEKQQQSGYDFSGKQVWQPGELDKAMKPDEGIAGKGPGTSGGRDPKVKAMQSRYNVLVQQLVDAGEDLSDMPPNQLARVKSGRPALVEDGIRGRNTNAAAAIYSSLEARVNALSDKPDDRMGVTPQGKMELTPEPAKQELRMRNEDAVDLLEQHIKNTVGDIDLSVTPKINNLVAKWSKMLANEKYTPEQQQKLLKRMYGKLTRDVLGRAL